MNLKDVLNKEVNKLQADVDHTKKSIDATRTSIDEWLDSFKGVPAPHATPWKHTQLTHMHKLTFRY